MTFITFFIVIWTVIAFAWVQAEVPRLNKNRWYQLLEVVILAPVTVWAWFKIGVEHIVRMLNHK